jgi:hypothetical protein
MRMIAMVMVTMAVVITHQPGYKTGDEIDVSSALVCNPGKLFEGASQT